MPVWLQTVLVVAAVAVLAPLVALNAKRLGRGARGGVALAGLLLGLGQVADPPSKHLIEACDPEAKEAPTPGDPPDPGA